MSYETTDQTANNIRDALKRAFPDVAFTVTTESADVRIRWTDGPMLWQVKEAIDFLNNLPNTYEQEYGYRYRADSQRGIEHVISERVLSSERKQKIQQRIQRLLETIVQSANSPEQWESAELSLIQEGELSSTYRTLDDSEPPVIDRRQELPTNVGACAEGESPLTPEQELKYYLMNLVAEQMLVIGQRLLRHGEAIDDLFHTVANEMYGNKQNK